MNIVVIPRSGPMAGGPGCRCLVSGSPGKGFLRAPLSLAAWNSCDIARKTSN